MRIYLQQRSSLVAEDGDILLDRPLVGGDLKNISRLETSPELETFRKVFNNGRLVLICDVDNPLLGPRGATYTYGPQKGATTSAILEDLEMGMANAAKHIDAISLLTSATCTSSSVATMVGAGGAGGMSGAFAHALGAQWKCGADVVADMVDLPRLVRDADVVITGEGSFDSQTLHHRKTVAKLAELVAATNREDGKQRSVSVVCGRTDVIVQVGQEELNVVGTTTTCDDDEDERMARKVIQCVVPISSDRGGPFDSAEAMRNTAFCIEEVVADRAAHILSLAQQPLL